MMSRYQSVNNDAMQGTNWFRCIDEHCLYAVRNMHSLYVDHVATIPRRLWDPEINPSPLWV